MWTDEGGVQNEDMGYQFIPKRENKEELQKPTKVTKRYLKHVEKKAGIASIRSEQNRAQDDAWLLGCGVGEGCRGWKLLPIGDTV